jgi:hypothetical protein
MQSHEREECEEHSNTLDSENVSLDEEKLYWGECLLSHGKKSEIREALGKILEGFGGARNVTRSLVEEFCKISVGQNTTHY